MILCEPLFRIHRHNCNIYRRRRRRPIKQAYPFRTTVVRADVVHGIRITINSVRRLPSVRTRRTTRRFIFQRVFPFGYFSDSLIQLSFIR